MDYKIITKSGRNVYNKGPEAYNKGPEAYKKWKPGNWDPAWDPAPLMFVHFVYVSGPIVYASGPFVYTSLHGFVSILQFMCIFLSSGGFNVCCYFLLPDAFMASDVSKMLPLDGPQVPP